MICEQIRLSGRVEIVVIDDLTGEVVDTRSMSNLIVDMGKNFYARITGDPAFTSTIRQIAMGKGTIPPDPSDTNLGIPLSSPGDVNNAALAIAPVTRSNPTSKIAKFVATFPSGGLVTTTANISELILIFDSSDRTYSSGTPIAFTANGGVFARIGGFAPFAKSSGQTVVVTWYTLTEYAFVSTDCDCCDRVVLQLPDLATIPIDLSTDPDVVELRELSQTSTFLPPIPTPEDGKILEFRVRSSASQQLIWPANFSGGALYPLPVYTSGSGGKLDTFFFEYNSYANGWVCISKDMYANIVLGRNSVTTRQEDGVDYTIIFGRDINHSNAWSNTAIGQNITIGDVGSAFGCGFNLVIGTFFDGSPCTIGIGDGASFSNIIIAPEGGTFTLNDSEFNVFLGSSNSVGDSVNVSVGIGSALTLDNCANIVAVGDSITVSSFSNVVALGQSVSVVGNSNVAIGRSIAIGSVANPSTQCIAIGDGAGVSGNRTGSQAYGAGASATSNNQIVFGSGSVPINVFEVVSDAPGNPALIFFGRGNISANLDSAFYLLYKNSVGTITSRQVKVDPVTGALTVPLV